MLSACTRRRRPGVDYFTGSICVRKVVSGETCDNGTKACRSPDLDQQLQRELKEAEQRLEFTSVATRHGK